MDPAVDHRTHRRWAWAVPAAVIAAVAGGAFLVNGGSASANPALPARTAQQLVTDVLSSSTRALSGSVSETADLGLPALPGGSSQVSLSWQQLLTGTTTARVWIDGPQRQRIAVTGQLSEAEVVHSGSDVWTYTSHDNTVSHRVLPAEAGDTGASDPTAALTPTDAARRVLDAVGPTTAVSVSDTATVAGRSAYTLIVSPRDARSTVREVAIAVDAGTGVPLRVQVYGAGSKAALDVGFTSLDFTTPPASTFAFTPPAGAAVTNDPFGSSTGPEKGSSSAPPTTAGAPATSAAPTVTGTGWTSVVEFTSASSLLSGAGSQLDELTTTLPSGARLLHTALINAILLPEGRAYAGAVSPDVLEQTAANH